MAVDYVWFLLACLVVVLVFRLVLKWKTPPIIQVEQRALYPIQGVFRHYKGGLYTVLFVARLSEARETEVVVYVSHTNGSIWVRPLHPRTGVDAFVDVVVWPNGESRPRFVPELITKSVSS
jgi:hypothetical protein